MSCFPFSSKIVKWAASSTMRISKNHPTQWPVSSRPRAPVPCWNRWHPNTSQRSLSTWSFVAPRPRVGWKRCRKHRWLFPTDVSIEHRPGSNMGCPMDTEIGHVRSSTLQGYCWAIMEPQVIPTDPKWVCLKIDSPKLDDWAPHFAKIATILGFTLFSDTPWYTQMCFSCSNMSGLLAIHIVSVPGWNTGAGHRTKKRRLGQRLRSQPQGSHQATKVNWLDCPGSFVSRDYLFFRCLKSGSLA